MITLKLRAPLFTNWTEQYVKLTPEGVLPGRPMSLTIDGVATPFQYTPGGHGGEIVVRLGFAAGETKELMFAPIARCETDLQPVELSLAAPQRVGAPGRELVISEPILRNGSGASTGVVIHGPFASYAGFPFDSEIHCDQPLLRAALTRTNEGPLFTDYRLSYEFAQQRTYVLRLRCYKLDPYIEVDEQLALGMNARIRWTINPQKHFTHIVSRDSFEGENQPSVEPLGAEHPSDVLCRLQMPVLTEYFVPNNRGWFAFIDQRDSSRAMLGILGLYGARWEEPVANMPQVLDRGGAVEWNASLASGRRHWLLYAGPAQTQFTAERPFVFHRLHGEFNALRLDEHLDLSGDGEFDRSVAGAPGMFEPGDYHAAARRRVQEMPCLRRAILTPSEWMRTNGSMHQAGAQYLVDPSPANAQRVHADLLRRFEKWVRQFQGHRTGQGDYSKNVIGFSRLLRGMLMSYEMLRRDNVLSDEQVRTLNAYFVFAARRILDEGRWPHSKTWKHPDHPESTRDFYAYGGEHKPDRLVWTNCLPNFQSDPLCSLVHLSAIFPDHPDAAHWRRFALDDLDRQLDAYMGTSGAWEESINYALYTLSYFVITFRVLKHRCGIDYFHDERLRRFAAWLTRFFGPMDMRFGTYTFPGIGNSRVPQQMAECLLVFAGELESNDPLRGDLLAVWKCCEATCHPDEHYPLVMAAAAPIVDRDYPLRPQTSENMDEIGIAMRHDHLQPRESYLFQKIGFTKDHYEADESSFNWYAKGAPFCMDYATYTSDIAVAGAHNLVEIPDADPLRRGYLAKQLFTPVIDYTHCEIPVTLKLLWGRVRSFAEVDGKDGIIDRTKTPYFYIGDKNPVGPKAWKVRLLLFVKPDYVVLFDRVYGQVPHRYNLHFTGDAIKREGSHITARGRFDLDLRAFIQHPAQFEIETGELIPNLNVPEQPDEKLKHGQHYFRLNNQQDGIYRTVLFAQEQGRDVHIESLGSAGVRIVTPEYEDHAYLADDTVTEAGFTGRAGWIRRWRDGRIQACISDGERIEAFGVRLSARGPWTFNVETPDGFTFHGGPVRRGDIQRL